MDLICCAGYYHTYYAVTAGRSALPPKAEKDIVTICMYIAPFTSCNGPPRITVYPINCHTTSAVYIRHACYTTPTLLWWCMWSHSQSITSGTLKMHALWCLIHGHLSALLLKPFREHFLETSDDVPIFGSSTRPSKQKRLSGPLQHRKVSTGRSLQKSSSSPDVVVGEEDDHRSITSADSLNWRLEYYKMVSPTGFRQWWCYVCVYIRLCQTRHLSLVHGVCCKVCAG